MKTKYSDVELAKIQIEKEVDMKTAGIDRFYLNNDRAEKKGSASETQWNRRIMQELIDPLAQAIQAYLDYYEGKRGKPSKTLTYLKLLPTQQAAFITIKNILDSLTRETEISATSKVIGSRIEDQIRFSNIAEAAPKFVEKVQKTLRQSNSKKYKHSKGVLGNAEEVVVKGNKNFDPMPEISWKSWPEQDLFQLGSKLIDIFHDNILFEGHPIINKQVTTECRNGKKSKAYIVPTEHIEQWIDRYKEVMEIMAPAFAPCVIPPRDWKSPTDGGYHIPEIAETLPLVKCRKSQRKRLTKKQMPLVYNAINTLQHVSWTICDKVYETVQDCIRLNLALGIPDREPYVISNAPVNPEFKDLKGPELKEAMTEQEWSDFVLWKKEANKLYSLNLKRKADYKKLLRIMGSASQYVDFEKIYFVYTMDFRGRVYCKSDSISPQGDDLQKGLIRFAEGMPLGDSGYKWLAVHGANEWGEDKISFAERVKFIEDMTEQIRDIATDPLTYTEWAAADSPWQFLNWCFEWSELMDWIEDGNKAEDFVSHIPVAMDGSCSGIQHYSAILRDPIGGAAVNLVPDTKPHDIYGDVAKIATIEFERLTKEGKDEFIKKMDAVTIRKTAEGWLNIKGGVSRGITKSPTMTVTYGSTQIRCLDTTSQYLTDLQVKEDQEAKAQNRESVNVHPFAERKGEPGVARFEAEKVGSKVIWHSIGEVATAARTAMKYIQDIAKEVSKTGHHLEWITPTGFIVEQKEYDYTRRKVKTHLLGNTFFSLKEELPELNVRKMKTASAPNFIHSLDASHLIMAVNRFQYEGIESIAVIHDSFGTHAGNTETLRRCLLDSFVDMYQSNDVLREFKEYNEGRILALIEVEIPETMNLDLEEVRQSIYCFS